MYTIYTDKDKLFSCDIDIKGGSISESVARLIIETEDNVNLLYKGTIKENGNCEININKLKLLPENTKGKIKLEVITEGTYFTPWESNFVVETSKKVTIKEVYDNDSKLGVTVKVKEENLIKEDTNQKYLDEHISKIKNLYESKENKYDLKKILDVYYKVLDKKNIKLTEEEIKYINNKINL
jgi:hypothetical protein